MAGNKNLGIFILVCLTAAVGSLRAEDQAGEETVITADTLLFDYQQRMCVFEGNVVVVDPQMRMESQKLHVFFDASNNVESVVATESVKVVQEDRIATCGRAVYTAGNGAIVMTINPVLTRGRDQLRGDEIRIYVHSEKVIASPAARLVVFPGTEGALLPRTTQKPPGEATPNP